MIILRDIPAISSTTVKVLDPLLGYLLELVQGEEELGQSQMFLERIANHWYGWMSVRQGY